MISQRPLATLGVLLVAGMPRPAAAQAEHRLHAVADALIEAFVPSRDDPDATVALLLREATGHARSAVSALCVDATGRFLPELDHPDDAIAAFRTYLESEPHGVGELAASVLLRRLLDKAGRFDEHDAIDVFGEYARHFIAIGPFGDSGDYFTGVPFPPELEFPAPGEELPGRFGKVSSYVVEREANRRTASLAKRSEERKGCFYGLLQLRVGRPTSGYAEVLTRSSFEMWVNGVRVATADRQAELIPGRIYVPLRLLQGVNHVLVKTTVAAFDDVALRLVDAAGRRLGGIEEIESDRLVPREGAAAEEPPDAPPFVDGRRALASAAAQAAGGPSAHVLALANVLTSFEQGAIDDGLEALFALEQSPPDDPRLELALAAALDMASGLPQEIRAARSRQLVESVAAPLKDHHYRAMREVEFLVGDDDLESAVRLLEARLAGGLGGAATFARLSSLLGRLRFPAELHELHARWHRAHPLDARPVLALVSARSRDGDARGALRMVLAQLERTPGERALLRRAIELAVELGDRALAERAFAVLQRDAGRSLVALDERAQASWRLGEVDAALAIYAEIANDARATAEEIRRAGRWLTRGGRDREALAAYERSLALDRSQHDLRRLVGRLRGQSEDFPLIARFRRDTDAVLAGFEAGDRERASPASLVLDQMIVRVYPDGSRVEETHQIRRINDLSGVDAYERADRAAGADEVVAVRTIGTDGRSYVPLRVANRYSMPRLEPGAFIEEVYREFQPAPGEQPWRGPMFYFQSADEPFLRTELVLILPDDRLGTIRSRNFPGTPEVVDLDGGYRAHVFDLRDVPRLKSERLTPPLEDIVPIVTFGSDRSVDAMARLRRIRASFATRPTPIVEDAARRATAGVEGDAARIGALYALVHRMIPESSGPPDPTTILLRRRGPRFFLLVAMLRATGVPVRHASAASVREALTDTGAPFFAGEDDYGMSAALVEPRDGAPLWLFADTPRYAPIGSIPIERCGAAVLVFGADGQHELRRLPGPGPGQRSGWWVSGGIRLDDGGAAELGVEVLMEGVTGYDLAERVRTLQQDNRQLVGRSLATRLFPGWTVRLAKLAELEPGDPMRLDIGLTRRGAAQPADDALWLDLPLPPAQLFRRFGDRGERTFPLVVADVSSEHWRLRIDPGDAFKIIAVPDPVHVRTELLDYELSFAFDGDELIVHRSLDIRPGRILPGLFPDWVATLQHIDAAERQRIRLRARR